VPPALLFEDRFHSLAYFDLLSIGLFQEVGEGGEGESIARQGRPGGRPCFWRALLTLQEAVFNPK